MGCLDAMTHDIICMGSSSPIVLQRSSAKFEHSISSLAHSKKWNMRRAASWNVALNPGTEVPRWRVPPIPPGGDPVLAVLFMERRHRVPAPLTLGRASAWTHAVNRRPTRGIKRPYTGNPCMSIAVAMLCARDTCCKMFGARVCACPV